jgi:hypothetical protein
MELHGHLAIARRRLRSVFPDAPPNWPESILSDADCHYYREEFDGLRWWEITPMRLSSYVEFEGGLIAGKKGDALLAYYFAGSLDLMLLGLADRTYFPAAKHTYWQLTTLGIVDSNFRRVAKAYSRDQLEAVVSAALLVDLFKHDLGESSGGDFWRFYTSVLQEEQVFQAGNCQGRPEPE